MISLETIDTWMNEFVRPHNQDDLMKRMVQLESDAIQREPFFCAYMNVLLSGDAIKNPVSASLYVLGVYETLKHRQDESDRLSKEIT